MRKLIDLDKDTIKNLSHLAVDANMSLKKFIETQLINIASGKSETLTETKMPKKAKNVQ